MSCNTGKTQLQKIGNAEQTLGHAFIKLGSDSGSENDIRTVIAQIDQLNTYYSLEISLAAFDHEALNEFKLTNSYNKSILVSALESN